MAPISKKDDGFTLFSVGIKTLRGDRHDRNKGKVNEATFLGDGSESRSTLEQLKAFKNTEVSLDFDLNGDGLIGGSLVGEAITATPSETENTIISKQSAVEGTAKNDFITAGPRVKEVWGYDGDDYLKGGNKSQEMRGGNGNDFLMGGKGNDTLIGGNGADMFKASRGQNKVKDFDWEEGDLIAISAKSDYSLESCNYSASFNRILEGAIRQLRQAVS